MNISRFSLPLLLLASLPAQWTQATPVSNPGNRASHGMASDPFGNVLLFGGVASVSPLNQTWLWNGTDWTQLTPATSPTPRQQMEVVYDIARSRYVVYGGWTTAISAGNASNQTWEFDGTTWTQMTPTATAGNICKYAACYDIARSRVVLYGGAANGLPLTLGNTWEYDGTTWTQVPGGSTPGLRENAAMCYSAALNRVVMFGGVDVQVGGNDTTWLFDGTSWTAAPVVGTRPPARALAKMVYDAARGVCVLVGGANPNTGAALNDAWEFNGTTWTQLPGTAPSVRGFGATYDLVHRQIVHYGGVNASSQVSSQTWLFGAMATAYGAGCPGTNGVPTLVAVDAPHLGATWSLVLNNNNLQSPVAIIVLGGSSIGPVPLDSIGMFGCAAYVTPDVMLTVGASAGVAPWSTTLPNLSIYSGAHLYVQGISFDPGVNPAWLTASNAIDGLVGF